MSRTAAQTVTDFGAMPTQNTTGPLIVEVTLMFDKGKPFVPADLLTALTTQYGAGKVFADKDSVGQNDFQLRIIP